MMNFYIFLINLGVKLQLIVNKLVVLATLITELSLDSLHLSSHYFVLKLSLANSLFFLEIDLFELIFTRFDYLQLLGNISGYIFNAF